MIEIVLNDVPCEVDEGTTLERLLHRERIDCQFGVAVACDGKVVPKERWSHHTLEAGCAVETLFAVQGG